MKENSGAPRLRLGFHCFHTYLYLPVSVAFGFFVALGRWADLTRLTPMGGMELLGAFHLVLPYLMVALDFTALCGLVGFTSFGRKWTIYANILKVLSGLAAIVYGVLNARGTAMTVAYGLLILWSILVILYYRKRSAYFPKGGRSWKETKAYHESLFAPEVKVEDETEPLEEEETEEAPEEAEEEDEETPEEEKPMEFFPWNVEYTAGEPIAKSRLTTAMFRPYSPLLVEEVNLIVRKGLTEVRMTVLSRSHMDIVGEEWLVNGKHHVETTACIPSGKRCEVKFMVNREFDRIKADLTAVTDMSGDRTEYDTKEMPEWPIPEKVLLSSLSRDDRYSWFLKEYISSTSINAKYCSTSDMAGKAVVCPVCGTPMAKEERYCPVCGLSSKERVLFEKDTVLSTFRMKMEG